MTKEEKLDWLYRLRSEIYVFMPKEWLIPMNNALDAAIKALEQEPKTWNLDDAREEAIKRLRGILAEAIEFENSVCYVTEEDREPLEMAIKALEQEPILDKLYAEIDKIYEREGNSVDCLNALNELKWFIDKHKAESESQESED